MAPDSNRGPAWGPGERSSGVIPGDAFSCVPRQVSRPAAAGAGTAASATRREDGGLHRGLEADQAQGAPRLPPAHLQAEEAAPPPGDRLRPPDSFELLALCTSIGRRVQDKCL